MLKDESKEAIATLRRVEKEIADAYWVDGGRIQDSDLERWAGEIYTAREILAELVFDHAYPD